MARYSKLFGGLIGALTPAGIVGLLALFKIGITVDQGTDILSVVTGLGSLLGVYLAPANAQRIKDAPEVPGIDPAQPPNDDEPDDEPMVLDGPSVLAAFREKGNPVHS